ncbi:hypothetical protein SAMN05444167_2789 [Terriglobus roseus]|uniref:Uncharacterized protein n=1 Tax=Terriglobus roseus TaxID=392734 RepID=A0A1G7MFR6_9BACT|nr:hypothetical protein SAMN05444167_2789 [Terriglobus roseus]
MKLILATTLLLSWIPHPHHAPRIMRPANNGTPALRLSFQLAINTNLTSHQEGNPIVSVIVANITLRSRQIPINVTLTI